MIERNSSGAEVSARVGTLVARYHTGDRALAARRLGIEPELLSGLLSGDWRRFSLEALVAVIRAHGVTIDWLLGSTGGCWDDDLPTALLWDEKNMEPERLS